MSAVSPALKRAGEERAASPWPELAQVMSLSAACAMLSGLLSAAAVKIIAALAGPAAIGLLSTLQQIRDTALTAASLNGGAALAQGASALAGRSRANYLRTAAMLLAAATALAAGFLAIAPAEAARAAGLAQAQADLVRGLAAAVILSSGFVFLTSLLNALGAARRAALLQLAGPGAMAMLGWFAARSGNFAGFLGACSAATVLAAAWALMPYRDTLARWWRGGRMEAKAARHFFTISGAMLVASLAGSAAFLWVRAHIVRAEGLSAAGSFDAALGLSLSQASLVLASLQTHYLPALARAADAGERRSQIRRTLSLAAPVSAAAIAVLAAFKPFWLSLLYSPEFHAASHYLRWTLVGDYLKVSSWILSIPMLARADMGVFLASDLTAAGCFLVLTRTLARFRSWPEAAAMAFVGMHAVHLAIGAIYLRRRENFRFSTVAGPWLAGFGLVGAVSYWKWNV